MELTLYTIHSKGNPNDLRVVGDHRRGLGVLPPVWALVSGLWITFGVMVALLALVATQVPLALSTVWFCLTLLSYLDGAEIERTELRLWGWMEVGAVEARTPEGAEELFLEGKPA